MVVISVVINFGTRYLFHSFFWSILFHSLSLGSSYLFNSSTLGF